jgi:hypothetical protein
VRKWTIQQFIVPTSLLLASCGDVESGPDPISEPADELRFAELEIGVPLRFDFGTSDSLVHPAAYRVTPTSHYSTTLGYGWLDAPTVFATTRTKRNAIDRDFNYTPDATFRVDVPNGVYDVAVRTGDVEQHSRSAIIVENFMISDGLQLAGEWQTHRQTMRVLDGNLDVRIVDVIADLGDPGDAIINGLTIARRNLPPDPAAWELHPSGVEYRRVTDAERIDNGWPIDSYLVHAPVGVFLPAPAVAAHVLVPIDNDEVLEVTLDGVGPEPALTIVELGFGVPSSGGSQSLVRYETVTSGVQGRLLQDTIRGGFWASVETLEASPLGVTSHQISNGEASWELTPIPLAGGVLPDGTVLYRSSALGPGPSSVLAPFPTDAYNFALIGEIQWCMARENGWAAALGARALLVHNGFAACPEQQCQFHHGIEMITRALFCNVTVDEDAAADCDEGINCPPNQFGHDYSYLNCNDKAHCYGNNIVANLQQAEDEGHFVPDLHVAQVVHEGPVKVISEIPPFDANAFVWVCGLAAWPDLANSCAGNPNPFATAGVSAVGDGAGPLGGTECALATSTHEFGHNFGAVHEATNENYVGEDGCLGTVMSWNQEKCNVFDIKNSQTLEICNLEDQTLLSYEEEWCPPLTEVEAVDCPRSGDELLFPPI